MASGATMISFTPQQHEQPASASATLDMRNGQWCLDFDAATDEYSIMSFIMPRSYAGGGITVKFWCWMTSATSGNVIMHAQIEQRLTDADSDSFAALQVSAATAVDSVSGEAFAVEVAFTDGAQMDSLAAGEPGRIKFGRDADNAGDTATGDLEVFALEIRES